MVTAYRPVRAVRVSQNIVRAAPSAVFCSTTFCQPWSRTCGSMLRKPLFGLAKRQLPRTLSDSLNGMTEA